MKTENTEQNQDNTQDAESDSVQRVVRLPPYDRTSFEDKEYRVIIAGTKDERSILVHNWVAGHHITREQHMRLIKYLG